MDSIDHSSPRGTPEFRFEAITAEETEEERRQADRRFASQDQRKAFQNLTFATLAGAVVFLSDLLRYKKSAVLDLRKRKLIDQTIVRDYQTVYLGSGIDIEYPLCLGSRKIILVDPIFQDGGVRNVVLDRIVQLTGQQPNKVSENVYAFSFDFGNGREEATVAFEHDPYDLTEEASSYTLPENVGMVLCFLSSSGLTRGHNLDARSVRDKLASGGMILVYGEALDEETMMRERMKFFEKNAPKGLPHDDKTARAFMGRETKTIYKQYGYEAELMPFSPAKGRVGEVNMMTFLKKVPA